MMSFRSYTALLTTFLFSLQILSATLPTNITNNETSLTANGKSSITCYQPAAFRSDKLATTRECLQAVMRLPEGADPETFDVMTSQLPWVEDYESCRVIVSMTGAMSDRSSWDHIKFSASQLLLICTVGQFPLGKTGGVMKVGKDALIRISIEKKPGVSLPSDDGGTSNVSATA